MKKAGFDAWPIEIWQTNDSALNFPLGVRSLSVSRQFLKVTRAFMRAAGKFERSVVDSSCRFR
jgi:hypothetical protein